MKNLLIGFGLLASAVCAYAASTPTLNFTDLTSGPVGSIVTVYGNNLQASVTVNGVAVAVEGCTTECGCKVLGNLPATVG